MAENALDVEHHDVVGEAEALLQSSALQRMAELGALTVRAHDPEEDDDDKPGFREDDPDWLREPIGNPED